MLRELLVLCFAVSTAAAQLTPPAGSPADSFRDLDQVAPSIPLNQETAPGIGNSLFRISESGRYVLTGNIDVPADMDGIEIRPANGPISVVIDLRGFEMRTSGGRTAIRTQANQGGETLAVRVGNGTIRGFEFGGVRLGQADRAHVHDLVIDLEGTSATGGLSAGRSENLIERVRLNGSEDGIFAAGISTVRDCSVVRSINSGISLQDGGRVTGCTVEAVSGTAIGLDGPGVVSGCVVERSDLGIAGRGGSVLVRDCTVSGCFLTGVTLDGGGAIRDSSISGIQGEQIRLNNGVISGCTVELGQTAEVLLASPNFGAGGFNGLPRLKDSFISGGSVRLTTSAATIDSCTLNGTTLDIAGSDHVITRNTLRNVTINDSSVGTTLITGDLSSPWNNFVSP